MSRCRDHKFYLTSSISFQSYILQSITEHTHTHTLGWSFAFKMTNLFSFLVLQVNLRVSNFVKVKTDLSSCFFSNLENEHSTADLITLEEVTYQTFP